MTGPSPKPIIGLTMGDAAGIGPELIVKATADPAVRARCRPVVFGHPDVIRRATTLVENPPSIVAVDDVGAIGNENTSELPCITACDDDVADVPPAQIDSRAGKAAYDCLIAAGEAAQLGAIDAIVTAPLNKAALNAAGLQVPGHTEVLAELCGVDRYAMMLFLPHGDGVHSPDGLCVAHVTLHTSIASVPGLLSTRRVREKIDLVDAFLQDIGATQRRIAVCALNPHGGEGGLFGNEETTVIAPAVESARNEGIDVDGPFPADTLIRRAVAGEFDGLVAMYHDQGHIAFKLLGFDRAVNVTLGLPIVRTSPSQGTAFDIAWQSTANPAGMIAAIDVAVRLVSRRG